MIKGLSLFLMFAFAPTVFANPAPAKNAALKSEMQVIGETYKTLGKQIDDGKQNAASEKLVDTLIDKSVAAQKQTPPGADKMKGPAREKMVKSYQGELQLMVDHLTNIKVALKSNDNLSARRHYDAIKPWTSPDHSKNYE